MQKITLTTLLTCILLNSCAIHTKKELPIVPEIKYALSGGAGHYDYAPSFIIDEYGIIYGYLCENREPFKIVDYIYLYKGIPTKDGYVWQPGVEVLAPSAHGWDDCHICDPDVREFKTRWKGQEYNYIMTYLGVDQWDCCHNQIGLAVSPTIEGPWTKYDGNPIIPYEGRDKWGTGQSTTIVKNDSTIVLYYHSTTQNGPFARREIVLNDLDNIRIGAEEKIPHLAPNSYPMYSDDSIYMVSEIRDDNYNGLIPTWVGNVCQVASMPIDAEMTAEINPWTELGRITENMSGFPRNHNPGFLTDTKGYLPSDEKLVVFFTPAVTGEDWLWSYDLYSATFNLKKDKR